MIWGAFPMWIPDTSEMASIGGTSEVSNWSGLVGAEPETPLGRLGGDAVTGGTITGAAAPVERAVAGEGGVEAPPGLLDPPGLGVPVGAAVGVAVGVAPPPTLCAELPEELEKLASPE